MLKPLFFAYLFWYLYKWKLAYKGGYMVRSIIFIFYCAVFSLSSQLNALYTESKALQDISMAQASASDFDATKIKAQKKLADTLGLEQRPVIAAQPDEEEFFDAVEYLPVHETIAAGQVSEDDTGYWSGYNSEDDNDGYASDSSGYDSDDDEGFVSTKFSRLKMPMVKVEQPAVATEYPSIQVESPLKKEPSYVTPTMRHLPGRTKAYNFIDTLGNKQRSMKFNVISRTPNTRVEDHSFDDPDHLKMLEEEFKKGDRVLKQMAYDRKQKEREMAHDREEKDRIYEAGIDNAYIQQVNRLIYPSFTESLALKAKGVYSYFFGK